MVRLVQALGGQQHETRIPAVAVLAAALAVPASAQAELLEAPVNTALPVVTGTPAVGQTLGVDHGTWLYAEGVPKYQWKRCNTDGQQCSNVAGATSSTFLLTTHDALATVRVTVTMSNLLGSTPIDTELSRVVPPTSSPGDGSDHGAVTDSSPTATARGGGAVATNTGPSAGGDAHVGRDKAGAARCLKMVSGRRRTNVSRLGKLRIAVAADSCIRTTAPLRLSFAAVRRTRVASVAYRLGATRVQIGRGHGHRVAFAPSKLRAGTHRLTMRVTPRRGKPRTVKLHIRFARV